MSGLETRVRTDKHPIKKLSMLWEFFSPFFFLHFEAAAAPTEHHTLLKVQLLKRLAPK